MDEKQFAALMDKLDKLLRLQTIETLKNFPSEREKVEFLDSQGFGVTEIDKMLGKSSGYASVTLYQMRKKKAPKPTDQPQPQTMQVTPEVTA